LPTYVDVTSLETGKKITVKVNDRGPFLHNRIIDLSYAAAHKLGIAQSGTGRVRISAISTGTTATENDASTTFSGTVGSIDGPVYYLQVGAYDIADNALEMRSRLRRSGQVLFPESDQEQLARGRPYRVRVGPFRELRNAQEAKNYVEQMLGQAVSLIVR
jgi:rare lipoprotein A